MKIGILTHSNFRSPRILANSLKLQLEEQNVTAEIFYDIDVLNRLVPFTESQLSLHFWLKRKLLSLFKDIRLLKRFRTFDAVIISECCPNGFLKRLYNIEKFRKIIKKPVGFYEVYFLGNAPSQINFLNRNNEPLVRRFDFHLSVAGVTEIKLPVSDNWFQIGINAKHWNLHPIPKEELIAIVDFVQQGFEGVRECQIRALNQAKIKYVSLEKSYTFEEIRNIYRKGAIFFIQFPEAFGVSILECLNCGCQIFTPDSGWPMSWRLNENPEIHGPGLLPDCFTVYDNGDQLLQQLITFKENYDLIETSQIVFKSFLSHYPDFYYGNQTEMKRFLNYFSQGA